MNTLAETKYSSPYRRLIGTCRLPFAVIWLVASSMFLVAALPARAIADVVTAEWGIPSNGLRCRVVTVQSSMNEEAVDLSQSEVRFESPEQLAFAVEVENVSDRPLRLLDTRYGDSYGPAKGKSKADWFGQFLFTIEYFDTNGAKIQHPTIHLIGGDSPVDGTLVKAIEPGGRHRFLLRPMKWLSIMTPQLGPGKFQAVVRYHGLPAETSEHLREHRPESKALGSWSGDAASRPTALELDSPANDLPKEVSWGEETDGLRAAMELSPHKRKYAFGEKPDLKLHLQNVSQTPITVATALWLSDTQADVWSEQNEVVDVGGRWYSGWRLMGRLTLQPQQSIALNAGNIAIAADSKQAVSIEHITNRIIVVPDGTYRIQLSGQFGVGFQRSNGKGEVLAPLKSDWSGTLKTGFAPLVIASQ